MRRLRRFWLWTLLPSGVLLSPAAALAGATVFTNTDNENNAQTGVADNDMDRLVGNADAAHPIEFRIDNVPAAPTTSAILTWSCQSGSAPASDLTPCARDERARGRRTAP